MASGIESKILKPHRTTAIPSDQSSDSGNPAVKPWSPPEWDIPKPNMPRAIVSAADQFDPESATLDQLLDAIEWVETKGNSRSIGDNGRAIGPYQIWQSYWRDALAKDPSIGGSYWDCQHRTYSRKVILAYWSRYATKARLGHTPTNEDRARIHNGGPNGADNPRTAEYWNRVVQRLRAEYMKQT